MPVLAPAPSGVTTLRLLTLRLTRRIRKQSGVQLTPSQLSALSALERHGELSMGRLAEQEQVGKSTLTRLVARLEELGLVQRERGEDDGRSWLLTLTAHGRELSATSGRRADVYLARQIAALDPEDQQHIWEALPALQRLLGVKA